MSKESIKPAKSPKSPYSKYFKLIIVLAVLVRFWNFTTPDLGDDGATYSFRALGWTDYMGGSQTSPIIWYDQIPWWGNISFHDAPPVVFAIQNIFFKFFGYTIFGARLPFVLAGIGMVILLYYILKRAGDERAGIYASLSMAVSALAVWVGLFNFLEGISVFFVALYLYYFIRYIRENESKQLIYAAIAAGLAFMTKYVTLFILPGTLFYLLVFKRDVFKRKELHYAILALVITLLPIIIYNGITLKERGHFDASLSAMVGMKPDDFGSIKNRTLNANFVTNIFSYPKNIYHATSIPFYILICISVLFIFYRVLRKKGDNNDKLLFILLITYFIQLLFSGGDPKQLSVSIPVLAICAGLLISRTIQWLNDKEKRGMAKAFIALTLLVFAGELFFNINTNVLPNSIGPEGYFYMVSRRKNYGWNQLHDYIRREITGELPKITRPKGLKDIALTPEIIKNKNVIIYDETMNWGNYVWYIQPYIFYYKYPAISLASLIEENGNLMVDKLKQFGPKGFYYILAVGDTVDGIKMQNEQMRKAMVEFADMLEKQGIQPVEIKDIYGNTAFKIYKFN